VVLPIQFLSSCLTWTKCLDKEKDSSYLFKPYFIVFQAHFIFFLSRSYFFYGIIITTLGKIFSWKIRCVRIRKKSQIGQGNPLCMDDKKTWLILPITRQYQQILRCMGEYLGEYCKSLGICRNVGNRRTNEPTYPSKTVENNEPLGTCTSVGKNCSTRTVLGNLKCGPGPQLINEENLLITPTFRSLNLSWLPKRLYKAEVMIISAM
jgi:hypothetical protein